MDFITPDVVFCTLDIAYYSLPSTKDNGTAYRVPAIGSDSSLERIFAGVPSDMGRSASKLLEDISLSGPMKSIEDSKKILDDMLAPSDKHNRMVWGIFTRESNECVGLVRLQHKPPWEPGRKEPGVTWVLSYQFLPEHWGKGYATETVNAMIEGVHTTIQPCTLQAYINPGNPRSAKVMDKVRFELAEKIYRPEEPRVFVGGEWREYDVWRYIRRL